MNAGNIEKAVEAVLESTVSNIHISKLGDETTIPNDASYAVVACERCDNLVGKLWKATVQITINSPAPSVSLDDHGNTVTTIVNSLNSASLYTDYNAVATNHTCGGGKILNVDLGIEENNYTHSIQILLGIIES
jgi:flagellar capping protein FliD